MEYAQGAVKVNIRAIAEGIVDMIRGTVYEGALSYGMLPAPCMQAMEREFDRKWPDCEMVYFENTRVILVRAEIKSMKRDIIHAVSTEILAIAGERGILLQ